MDALRGRMESGLTLSWLAENGQGLGGRYHGLPKMTRVRAISIEAAGDVCPVKRSTGGTCLSAPERSVGRLKPTRKALYSAHFNRSQTIVANSL